MAMVASAWREPPPQHHPPPDDITRAQPPPPTPHDPGSSHHNNVPPQAAVASSIMTQHVPSLPTTPQHVVPPPMGEVPCNGPPQTPTTPGGQSVVSDGSIGNSLGGTNGDTGLTRPQQNGSANSTNGDKTHIECVVSLSFCYPFNRYHITGNNKATNI